ncbi:X8 domain-containing protein [Cephalotus follicularis]|uniref:X8 domain-containing protein n=1 Tax=Cephalotus follicularis TaxID=3775 RepID=A0A1Q3B3Z4_CEPFO|nr:X8 domain-containing protein [Cephalotus follicularis]
MLFKYPIGSPSLTQKHSLIIMAIGASKLFFFFLLPLLSVCSSGTLVGFSYDARGTTSSSSTGRAVSFFKLNKAFPSQIRVLVADDQVLSALFNSGVSVDFYLNQSLVENLISYKSSAISWLKTLSKASHVNIKSIVISSMSDDFLGQNELPKLLSKVKSIHSVIGSLHFSHEIKVSIQFSLSFLENLNKTHESDLNGILGFLERIGSFVIVQASIYEDLSIGDPLVQSIIKKAGIATSLLPCDNVPMVLSVKSHIVHSTTEVAEFTNKILKSSENNTEIKCKIAKLYAEISFMEGFAQEELEREGEQIFPFRRELNNLRTTSHDTIFSTTPVSTALGTIPPYNPTPTIVTVPATNPVTITPNPDSSPVPIPSTTPVTVPSTTPGNPEVPITNPVTTPSPVIVPGAQPITNPVTTYPAPAGNVPVTTPVTNPLAPPATTNAPVIPGQSWCMAKTGTAVTALQTALDYACGMGGADCSQIQLGGSCYNPNTLQNHASYAFNSYYQKNPVATSCDFGGAATLVNSNPSTVSCIYPSSSSPQTTPTNSTPLPSTTTTTPIPATTTPTQIPATTTPTPTPATTPSSGGTGVSGYGTPPTVLNSSTPASTSTNIFGSDSPPGLNTSTSMSTVLQPYIGCIVLITSFVIGVIIPCM